MDICDGHVSSYVDYIDRNDHVLIAYFILLGLMTCGHGGLTRIIWPFTRARSLSEPIDTSKRFCCMFIDFVTDELCSFNSCTAIFQFQCTSGVSIVAISRCCSCVSARNSTNDSKWCPSIVALIIAPALTVRLLFSALRIFDIDVFCLLATLYQNRAQQLSHTRQGFQNNWVFFTSSCSCWPSSWAQVLGGLGSRRILSVTAGPVLLYNNIMY